MCVLHFSWFYDCGSNDRIDRITTLDGVAERFDQDHRRTLATHITVLVCALNAKHCPLGDNIDALLKPIVACGVMMA